MLNSWVNGIQRKNKCASPTNELNNTKSTSQKITEDMDYRKLSSAEGEIIDDDDDDNNISKQIKLSLKTDDEIIDQNTDMYDEDTDFRQHVLSGFSDSFVNRRFYYFLYFGLIVL